MIKIHPIKSKKKCSCKKIPTNFKINPVNEVSKVRVSYDDSLGDKKENLGEENMLKTEVDDDNVLEDLKSEENDFIDSRMEQSQAQNSQIEKEFKEDLQKVDD